ncbi:MFS transporter [Acanthopleuribacter pedis]|uniref:MFS transporter n=1 Tax=Acanthopleuribacter pedis TaxID=442870 RepID=A0A8J7QGI7_9BACT|nr:MFS transporter [Acanthopleuribacter pedis]MBO1321870.1 MFS transporter [Acanthopleuribacter pedis]
MDVSKKAVKIDFLDLKTVPMRTFHLTWLSFFMCFFGWFGIAPLMVVIRDEFSLSKSQIGNIIIASVAMTVFVRVALGWVCDRFGPRRVYVGLLSVGALLVMGIGLSQDYETFLVFRLLIGAIGAGFVITQYHTSVMFAPNVVGTANATTAGWGNLGGGVTLMVMPRIYEMFIDAGFTSFMAWRLSMIVPGVALLVCAVAYFFFTKDYPEGNVDELDLSDEEKPKFSWHDLMEVGRDYRVWLLFLFYGACFGIELTINNVAALYYADRFSLSLVHAGMIAGLFGLMNIFARSLGGFLADKAGIHYGLKGRVRFLWIVLMIEGLILMVFSRMDLLPLAVMTMLVFSLFVQMAEGATFSVVPFINRKSLGLVAGLVGAGGNAGAVLAGFLLRSESLSYSEAFSIMGMVIVVLALAGPLIRFSEENEEKEARVMRAALERRAQFENPSPLADRGVEPVLAKPLGAD